jgi:hypothetical protein
VETAKSAADSAAGGLSTAYETAKAGADNVASSVPTPFDIEQPGLVMEQTPTAPVAVKVEVTTKGPTTTTTDPDVLDTESKEDPLQT